MSARLALLLLGVLLSVPMPAQEARFENLQIVPEDIQPTQLLQLMKVVTRALGTNCQACHESARGDFASDAPPLKARARAMMQMEAARRPALDWGSPPETLCMECHNGELRPRANQSGKG